MYNLAISEHTLRFLSPDVYTPPGFGHLHSLHPPPLFGHHVGVASKYLTTLQHYSDFKCKTLANPVDIVLGMSRIILHYARVFMMTVLVRALKIHLLNSWTSHKNDSIKYFPLKYHLSKFLVFSTVK